MGTANGASLFHFATAAHQRLDQTIYSNDGMFLAPRYAVMKLSRLRARPRETFHHWNRLSGPSLWCAAVAKWNRRGPRLPASGSAATGVGRSHGQLDRGAGDPPTQRYCLPDRWAVTSQIISGAGLGYAEDRPPSKLCQRHQTGDQVHSHITPLFIQYSTRMAPYRGKPAVVLQPNAALVSRLIYECTEKPPSSRKNSNHSALNA